MLLFDLLLWLFSLKINFGIKICSLCHLSNNYYIHAFKLEYLSITCAGSVVQPLKVVLLGISNKRWLQSGQKDETGFRDGRQFVSEQKIARANVGWEAQRLEGNCVCWGRERLNVQANHSKERMVRGERWWQYAPRTLAMALRSLCWTNRQALQDKEKELCWAHRLVASSQRSQHKMVSGAPQPLALTPSVCRVIHTSHLLGTKTIPTRRMKKR